MSRTSLRRVAALALGLFLGLPVLTHAREELILAIQPVLGDAQTRQTFQPLADYIARATGRKCVIQTSPNFMAYWDTARKGTDYDLALDAAHFTDYRIHKLGFVVLAKIPDSVTYSLVVPDDAVVLDPAELVAKRIATLGVPSIGAARLNALFPNPARQPFPVEVASAEEGMALLLTHRVAAAILPTPIVSQQMQRGGGISVVLTTDPIPHIALTAGPTVDAKTREAIRKALLQANATPEGKQMLAKIGFERFDPATAAVYAGQAQVLKAYWGY
jgi:hypothetical protein